MALKAKNAIFFVGAIIVVDFKLIFDIDIKKNRPRTVEASTSKTDQKHWKILFDFSMKFL